MSKTRRSENWWRDPNPEQVVDDGFWRSTLTDLLGDTVDLTGLTAAAAFQRYHRLIDPSLTHYACLIAVFAGPQHPYKQGYWDGNRTRPESRHREFPSLNDHNAHSDRSIYSAGYRHGIEERPRNLASGNIPPLLSCAG